MGAVELKTGIESVFPATAGKSNEREREARARERKREREKSDNNVTIV